MSKIPQEAIEPLDWASFDEIKLNRGWVPDDQELIYTAINAYNGEGDMDDDCLEQIIERLLLAWRRADAARAQGAEVEPVPLIHMAVSDEDGLRWMTGRKHPNGVAAVELYAMADFGRAPPLYATPPAPQPTDREKVLEEALRPFAECADLIETDVDDEEWAKFRLVVKDCRIARAALAGGEA